MILFSGVYLLESADVKYVLPIALQLIVVAGPPLSQPGTVPHLYVRDGASGSGDGSNWTNAYDDLPAALSRGIAYYLADGSYAAYVVDDPLSGTTPITIRKATDQDHGAASDWSSGYGDGTATFTSFRFATGYVSLSGWNGSTQAIVSSTLLHFRNVIGGGVDPSRVKVIAVDGVRALYSSIIAQDVTITRSDFGGFNACDTSFPSDVIQVFDDGVDEASSRITFDNVDVHDVTDNGDSCAGTPGAGRHVDCMQWLGGHDLIVRNSRFYNCATSNILGESFRDTLDGFIIENNFFQNVMHPGVALNFGALVHGVNTIRFNTIAGSLSTAATGGTINVTGNILTVSNCGNGVFDRNLFVGGTQCGTNRFTGSPLFVNPLTPTYFGPIPDYHLQVGDTAAKGNGGGAPHARDYDGQSRPLGAAADLGADEIPR